MRFIKENTSKNDLSNDTLVASNIDDSITTPILLYNADLYFNAAKTVFCNILAGATRHGTTISIFNSGEFYVTVAYHLAIDGSSHNITLLTNEFVKLKWNGSRWIIIESNMQEFLDWNECFYSMSRTAEIDAINHIYELTVTGDKTAYFKAGQKIKFTQDASTKYAIITYVETSGGNTILTVYGGTDYAISANAITSAKLAKTKTPYDFDCSSLKWSIIKSFTPYTKTSPSGGTYYNTGSANSFYGEKGEWNYSGCFTYGGDCPSSFAVNIMFSESNNSKSNTFCRRRIGSETGMKSACYFSQKRIYTARTQLYTIIASELSATNIELDAPSNTEPLMITPACL